MKHIQLKSALGKIHEVLVLEYDFASTRTRTRTRGSVLVLKKFSFPNLRYSIFYENNISLHFSTKKHTADIFLPINVDMFEDFYNIKSCNSRHMPVYFLSSFPINKFSRCRALSSEVLR